MTEQVAFQTPKEILENAYDEQLTRIKQRARTAEVEAEATRSKAMRELNELYCGGWTRFLTPAGDAAFRIRYESEVDVIYSKFQKSTQTAFQVFQDATSRLSAIRDSFDSGADLAEQADSLTDVVNRLQAVFSKPLAADKIKFVFTKHDPSALPRPQRRRYYD